MAANAKCAVNTNLQHISADDAAVKAAVAIVVV